MIRFAVLTGGLALLAACVSLARPADPAMLAQGERAFQRCYACHAASAGDNGADGPHMGGVVGRKIASLPGYAYSPALRAYGSGDKRWTPARLDRFLADPHEEVPDNTMGFFGITDPVERTAVIEWLAVQR